MEQGYLLLHLFCKNFGQVCAVSGKINSVSGIAIFMRMEVYVWIGTVCYFV
jgi:hypothetical protein